MYLNHLSLAHFRNYHTLELDFDGPLTLLQGANTQGKTNLPLEQKYSIATSKPVHTLSEREVVDWEAAVPSQMPTAAWPHKYLPMGAGLTWRSCSRHGEDGANFKKQVRINGVNRRCSGRICGLVARRALSRPKTFASWMARHGDRRRYLDIALCQMDRASTATRLRNTKGCRAAQ